MPASSSAMATTGFDAVEADVRGVRDPRAGVAVDGSAGHGREMRCSRRSRNAARPGPSSAMRARAWRRHAHADDSSHVLGAGPPPPPPACPPAMKRQQAQAPSHPEGAHALGPVELVGRQREEIDPQRLHVHRDLAGGLHGIGVDHGAAGPGQTGELETTGWIVPISLFACMSETTGAIWWNQGRRQHLAGDQAAGAHRQQGRLPSPAGERLQGVEDRLVLDPARNQVQPAGAARGPPRRREWRNCHSRCRCS